MARLLATVLLMTGLALLAPPPAHAALSVTISATPTTLMAGESTTIKGKAIDAKPGSVVKLQRKVSGVWKTVTQKKVWSTRTYSFTIKPPRGYQYYRVRKPAQLGQAGATSPAIKLTVRWQPLISIVGTNGFDPATGKHWLDVNGQTSGLPAGANVILQRQTSAGAWESQPWGTIVGEDGTFPDLLEFLPHAARIRYTMPASGARLAAYSNPVTVYWERYAVGLNTSVQVSGISPTTPQTVRFTAALGQFVTLALTHPGHGITSLVGPAGPIDLTWNSTVATFRVPAAGVHELTLTSDFFTFSMTLSVSTIKSVTSSLESEVQVMSDVPGQVVAVHFAGLAGEVVSQYSPHNPVECGTVQMWRGGFVLPPWAQRRSDDPSEYYEPVWRLPADGQYTLLYTPCGNGLLNRTESLMRANKVTAVVNTSPATAVVDRPGRVVIVEIEATSGQELTVMRDWDDPAGYLAQEKFYSPDGASFVSVSGFRKASAQAGTYRILVSKMPGHEASLTYWASTPLAVSPAIDGASVAFDAGPFVGRQLLVSATGSPDSRFALLSDSPDGSPCASNAVISAAREQSGPALTSILGHDIYELWAVGVHQLRFDPCVTEGTIALVSVADPTVLVPNGSAETVVVSSPGRPVVATFEAQAGTTYYVAIEEAALPEGDRFWGSVGLLNNRVGFSGLAGKTKILTVHATTSDTYFVDLSTERDSVGSFQLRVVTN